MTARLIARRASTEFPGLSVEARRAINLAVIAYAEVLCLRLADTPLVALAREATSRREVADQYGERRDCERLIAEIGRARAALDAKANIAHEVRSSVKRLKATARYRQETNTTPL